jgi:transcriptional regulator with XRE-family HTH domain
MNASGRLKYLREQMNLSQEDFAAKLGLTKSAISDIERGRKTLTERNISYISTIYGINPHWLRTGEEPVYFANKLPMDAVAAMNGLSDIEMDILRSYMRLPYPDRQNILQALTVLIMESEQRAKRDMKNANLNNYEFFDRPAGRRVLPKPGAAQSVLSAIINDNQ